MYNLNLTSVMKAGTKFVQANNNFNMNQYFKPNMNTDENQYTEPDTNSNKKQNSTSDQNRKPNAGYNEGINEEEMIEVTISKKQKNYRDEKTLGIPITQSRLQEAVVWSEILGKPLCKRGKRR